MSNTATKQSDAYRNGVAAFDQGLPSEANPHPPKAGTSSQRIEWFNGWYDQDIGKRLGHIFKRHGIVWP